MTHEKSKSSLSFYLSRTEPEKGQFQRGSLAMFEGNVISSILISAIVIFIWNFRSTNGLSCKDENNNDIDWYINIKLPKIKEENKDSDLYKGKAYVYLKSGKDANWILSSDGIDSRDSMLGFTWKEFSDNIKNKGASYLMYNDDPPEGFTSNTVGHLKGILAFDGSSGFWLTHSIPNFAVKGKFQYPPTAEINGQTALCMTFNTSQLKEICNHLLYCHPNIYERYLMSNVESFLDENAKSIFSSKPAFIRRAPFFYESKLKSLKGVAVRSFAKDNQLPKDIYSDLISPALGASLVAETWRRGAGGNLDSACGPTHSVVDVTTIRMTALEGGGEKREIAFKSTEDHSKWAISTENSTRWICIGDLNRMKSQAKRGGGALCFQSRNVWKAFQAIIGNTDICTI